MDLTARIAAHPVANAVRILADAESAWHASGGGDAETEAAETARAALVAALDADDERTAAISHLHVSDGAESPFCTECGHAYPCATLRLLLDGPA